MNLTLWLYNTKKIFRFHEHQYSNPEQNLCWRQKRALKSYEIYETPSAQIYSFKEI